jgi:indole-3-glycerol phosphate synthase
VTADILQEIVARKREEVAAAKARVSPVEMQARARASAEPCRGFRRALAAHVQPAVIAEIKRRSPSKGEIRPDFDPALCAQAYAAGGAACLSVLTDEPFFGGRLENLDAVRAAVPLPVLRKDFTIGGYQVDEARCAGADAVLLIVSCLTERELRDLASRARDLDLDVLVEVHDERELEAALAADANLVGVNNRDLSTFEVDLGTTERLAAQIPASADVLLVAESGIACHADVERLAEAGARAFLVGESLMRQRDVAGALKELRGAASHGRVA